MKGCVLPLNLFELIAYELDDSMETYNALRATNSAVKQAIDSSLFKRTFFYDLEKMSWNGRYSQRLFPVTWTNVFHCHVLYKPSNDIRTSYAYGYTSLGQLLDFVREVATDLYTYSNIPYDKRRLKNMCDELSDAINMLPK